MARLTDTIVDGYLQVAGDSSTLTSNNNTLNSDTSNSYTLNVTNINTVDICSSGSITSKTITLTATSGSPMIVYSETQVPHLNASLLQGHTIGGANELFLLDSEGMIPTYTNVDKVGTGDGPTDNYTNRVQHEAYNEKLSGEEICHYGIVRKSTENDILNLTADDCFVTPKQMKELLTGNVKLYNASTEKIGAVILAKIDKTNNIDDITNCTVERNGGPVVVTPATLAKAKANGVASLDASGKIPSSQINTATETVSGTVELATETETATGTNKFKVITAYDLSYYAKNNIVIYEYDIPLDVASWVTSADGSYYTCTLTGIIHSNSKTNVQLLPSKNISAKQLRALQYANIQDSSQNDSGTIILKAFGMKPTISIPIRLLVGGTVVSA